MSADQDQPSRYIFEKKEDITNEFVVDVNVPFLAIVHGIAFADLNFLNQPHQRGTV